MSKWYENLVERLLVSATSQKQIMEIEINEHLNSEKLKTMLTAYQYYRNKTDIRKKHVEVSWRTNTQIEMGLFNKFVKQKVGYLFSKEPTITCNDEKSLDFLTEEVFDEDLLRTIKTLGKEAVIKGIAWALPYYNEQGRLRLHKIPSEQIVPFWKDERHIELDAFMRVYMQQVYKGNKKDVVTVVEYWDENGVSEYVLENGALKPSPNQKGVQAHFYYHAENGSKQPYVWDKVPLIPFRYNEEEDSLLVQVKSLIDNMQLQASTNADILADIPKFIYVLKNYQGTDLEMFMSQLHKFRSIKVASDGGVDTLQAQSDTAGVEGDLARTRKALYEAARAIDTQDENLGNASGQALKWRYTDLDLDCNDLENEFLQSIQQFMWFVGKYAENNGIELDVATFKYQFNRDVISNESEAIQDCQNSMGILDEQTIRENHPWYSPIVEERLKDVGVDYRQSFQKVDGSDG